MLVCVSGEAALSRCIIKACALCGSLSLLHSVSLKEEFKGNDRITKAFKESLKDA